MKNRFLNIASFIFFSLLVAGCAQKEEVTFIHIGLAGNAYITATPENNDEADSPAFIDEGNSAIRNWDDTETVVSFYFKAEKSGRMHVALNAKGHSNIEVSLLGKKKNVTLDSDELSNVEVGTFKVKKAQYIKVDIRGKKINQGEDFGNVAALLVGGEVTPVFYVDESFSSHFGRRGPSVHLGYTLPSEDVEWFYNEVVVPEEGDIPSSYYMVCGFGEGYFGMQNNAPYPRRVLFSVWSPFVTDNPAEIPDSLRVQLVKRGENVTINDFGNEGSGGQSYMNYEWKAGERCRFLMGVHPDKNNTTVYTAYFYDNHQSKWRLVASWRRPRTTTWYTHAYSFLENFNPTMGYINRKAYYQNQWARTVAGEWVPLTNARFTCDETGRRKMRLDYTGGTAENGYYLSMGGFFDNNLETDTKFERTGNVTEAPDVDFSTLE